MDICPTCKNQLQIRRVKLNATGPFCKTLYGIEIYCPYCEWKGTAGPGKQLQEIIKDANTYGIGALQRNSAGEFKRVAPANIYLLPDEEHEDENNS